MWQYGFMQHAFEAGTIVAIVAGIVGYFIVLRRSSFAAHALAHIGFTGAAGAVLFRIAPIIGLLLFTGCGGITIAILGRRAASRDTQIGIVLSFMLGLGVLFISLYSGYATEAYSILFGEILGISNNDVIVTLVASLLIIFSTGIVYRPLLFSSLDGFTSDQRFFLSFAQMWRQSETNEGLRMRALTDPHSPNRFRVNGIVFNVPEFYKAFPSVKPVDKLYRPENERPVIW